MNDREKLEKNRAGYSRIFFRRRKHQRMDVGNDLV